jgi:hypothetical protein
MMNRENTPSTNELAGSTIRPDIALSTRMLTSKKPSTDPYDSRSYDSPPSAEVTAAIDYDTNIDMDTNMSPTVEPPSAHPSVMAVRGSVPPSPKLAALRGDYLGTAGLGKMKDEEQETSLPRSTKKLTVQIQDKVDKKIEEVVHNGRVIAIDFDDVMSQNVMCLLLEHNALYGTDLTM